MRKFSEFNNPITDQEKRERFLYPEMNSELSSKDHNITMLENFNKSYTNFNANIEKINVIQEELSELTKHTENLVKKEELETLLTSHLIFINENIQEIKSNLYGINQNDLDKLNYAIDLIDAKTANLVEYIGEELPRNKNKFIEIEYKVDKRISEIKDTFSDIVEYSYSNFTEIESRFESIKDEVSDNLEYKIDAITTDFTELKSATKANIKLTEIKLQKEVESEKRLDQLIENTNSTFDDIDSKFLEVDIFKEGIVDLIETKIDLFQEDFKEIKDTTKANYKLTESKIKDFKKEIDLKFELTEENKKEISKQITGLYEDIKFVNSDLVLLEKKYSKDLIPVVNKLNIFEQNLSSFDSVVSTVSKLKEDIKQVVFEVNTIFINDKYIELDNKIQKIEEIFENLSHREILSETQIKDITPTKEFVSNKKYTEQELNTILSHATSKNPSLEVENNLKAVTNKLRYLEQAISNIAMSSGGGGEVNLRWLDDVDYKTIADGLFLRYSAAKKKFEFAAGGGGGGSANITVANTAPTTNTSGSMWWNTDDGSLYIYYVDGTSSQWVPAAPAGKTGVVAVTSPLIYDSANSIISVDSTVVINEANTQVGIGGAANSTALLTISDTNLAVSANGTALNVFQRWNTTGNPTAFKINANNVSSGSISKLIDLQVDGASKFNVNKLGVCHFDNGNGRIESSYNHLYISSTDDIYFRTQYIEATPLILRNSNVILASVGGLFWGTDLTLYRDAANILAQRNGINPQTFRLYRNYTDSANVAYSEFKQDANTGLIINSVNTGSLIEPTKLVDYQLNGVSRFSVDKIGNISFGSPTSYASIDGINSGTGRELLIGNIVRAVGIKNNLFVTSTWTSIYHNTVLGWSSDPRLEAGDLLLARDAAGILAQRNGTANQTFRLYNTINNANTANFERGIFSWSTTANTLTIGTEAGGTGTLRNINFTGGTVTATNSIKANNFVEGVYTGGATTGTITPDVAFGSIQAITLTGAITLNAFANPIAGQSLTLLVTQPISGNVSLSSTMLFAGGSKALSTTANALDVITVMYTGSVYIASLSKGHV